MLASYFFLSTILVTITAFHLAIERPAATGQEKSQITPSSTWDSAQTEIERRRLFGNIAGGVGRTFSQWRSKIDPYVVSGVPNTLFQDLPTGNTVQSSLGLDDSQVAALPTHVLNLP